ncbi:MAG: hypothetical protein QXV21_01475 [Candidatus Bathyarchaeia archaeon]
MGSGSSERCRCEPKSWLKFEDVVNCRDVESLNAFINQYLSERGLVGERRRRTYYALVKAWNNGIHSHTPDDKK